ncbi:MAG: RDD family protein [Elusimicrobia bacterium]|nr:RDD family protein [Elusimicrobiota bacterium]
MEESPDIPALPAPEPAEFAGFWVRGGAYLIDTLILLLGVLIPVAYVSLFGGLAYRTIFIHKDGQTPGKMAAGIKVIAIGGGPVSLPRSGARSVLEYLSGILLGLGYVVAASPDKRALHDYIAGTRVVYVEGVTAARRTAFALLGVLAVKAGEGGTKGGLGSIRSALSIYYGDMEGQYPAGLDALAGHPETDAWTPYGAEVCTGSTEYGQEIDASKLKDTGGWGYVNDPKAKCWGQVFVDCTHRDVNGKLWAEF